MLWEILVLLLAFPTGLWLAWAARDELVEGRKWFARLAILSLIGGIISWIFHQGATTWTCLFILIVSIISYNLSHDKRWVKKRI